MADRNFGNDGVPEITRKEHDAKSLESKRVQVVGYIPGTDTPVRISASDNGDGTYSLKTTASLTGDVSIEGAGAYSDAADVDKKGLVDADRHVQTDVLSSALPSGAATSAKQDTIIGHVDGIEGLLATIDADTSNLSVVGSGTEATAQRVTIATDSTGVLSVDDNGASLTVDNAGLTELAAAINSSKVDVNIASSDVASGGTAAADDADFSAGTTSGTPAMGVYESAPTSVTDGDMGIVGITTARRLKTSTTIDAALPAGTAAIGKLAANDGVDIGDVTLNNATLAVTQSGTWDEVGINDSGNSITVDNATISVVGSGTEATAQRVTIATDSTGVLSVDDNGGALTVDNGGTFAVQVDGSALTSLQLLDDTVFTDDTSTHSTGTTKGLGIMAAATPTDTSVSANDIGMVAMTTDRRLLVDASGVAVPVTDNAGSLTVDYATTGSGTSTGALRVELPTNGTGVVGLNAGSNLVGKVGIDQTTPGTTNLVALTAETTKAIGVVRTADGSGNLLPSSVAEPAAGDRGLEVREAGTGFVSSNNSSTATLAANAVFTGTADTSTNYASISVYIFADQASATDGLQIQQSSDGTNWDVSDKYTVPANTGKTFGIQVTAANVRVVYTNGATVQGAFRLHTMLHKYMPHSSSIRPQDNRTNDNDMEEIAAYAANYDPINNVWNRARGSISSGLEVDVTRIRGTTSVNQDQVAGEFIRTVDKGVPLVGLAGPFGEPIDTNSPLNVTAPQGIALSSGLNPGFQKFYNAAASTTLIPVKQSRTNVYYLNLSNINTSNAFLQLFDTNDAVTLGTTVPSMTLLIPASGGYDAYFPVPMTFNKGLLIACTTTFNGSTAPTTGIVTNIGYI